MADYLRLLYVCQGAGILMILGGTWLIYREKIILNAVTKEPMFVELPFFGKLRTNAPALALFVLGLAAVMYPTHAIGTPYLRVKQQITSDKHPVVVYAVVRSNSLQNDGELDLVVPILNGEYEPQLVYVAGSITNQEAINVSQENHGVLELQPRNIEESHRISRPAIEQDLKPKPANF
jgi:hypothetical protein